MDWPGDLMTAAIVALLTFAACTDLATRLIPDSVSIALALLGLVGGSLAGVPSLALSIGCALLIFLALLIVHARGAIGGGDVKLMAATALSLSPDSLYRFVVVTALAGGALAVLHLILRRTLRGARASPPPRGTALWRRIAAVERWRITRHGSLPYGVAIACGGIWAVLASPGG